MFKAFLLSLLTVGAYATINNTTPIQNLDAGIHRPSLIPIGTPVYALNQALTGVASAAIDLSGSSGLWVNVTSTGAANVTVFFSNSNVSSTGGAVSSYTINSNGGYPIEPKTRYVSFYNSSNQPANKVSVNYYPVVTSAGSVTLAPGGTVTVNQGTAGPGGNCSNCWPVSAPYMEGYLTTTAGGSAASGGSITAIALTGTVLTNISVAAGANCPCICTIEGGTGPNAGFYWGILPSGTWVPPVTYLAVSTTPIMVTVGNGDFLQLSATAAAVTVNARVRYAPIK